MNLKSRITIATASVALATLGLAACSSANNDASTVNSGESNQSTRDEVVGIWGDAAASDKPSLEFTTDGTLSGSDGCNRITGSWTAEGEVVVFGPMASTKMACEGVETWLIDPASATVKGDVLTVSNSDGKEIGTLNRG